MFYDIGKIVAYVVSADVNEKRWRLWWKKMALFLLFLLFLLLPNCFALLMIIKRWWIFEPARKADAEHFSGRSLRLAY